MDNQANADMANKYGAQYIPTLVFIGKDGNVVNKIVGETTKDVLDKNVKKIMN
ncbi:MAG: thiol reductase thioredoxin [Candidatus Aquicultor secundus]|uniref:Thiol reductase thioredoxin n=1 Tax=Candidatus Aquicultor secundus TaxID=1973895 RepID=A0A2M7T8Z0_9ACTN|nr:MAG: thiol reductase thioredoxin [Candidatus Aquicultor secundus]PIW22187.1 MAG: thiol reductase thioredoxin [Candidatus Aquicultor secundus]PIX52335.1 MAG: thiol reductase thioredoxin [Candidatus Aquicultor secundus]PIY37814.1 MAG: thiol reductase thioredoxin [Candidatus Aquicultor secundus]PIZ39172.1 MAG: thiol reductase thioredoxin [Candidatus Aquicultor secundus]